MCRLPSWCLSMRNGWRIPDKVGRGQLSCACFPSRFKPLSPDAKRAVATNCRTAKMELANPRHGHFSIIVDRRLKTMRDEVAPACGSPLLVPRRSDSRQCCSTSLLRPSAHSDASVFGRKKRSKKLFSGLPQLRPVVTKSGLSELDSDVWGTQSADGRSDAHLTWRASTFIEESTA